MTTYKLNLSTTEPNNDVGLIKIRQDDTMTQRLSVTVYEHDKLVDLTGYDIYLNSKMPNQSTVRDKVTDLINPKNGHFSYTLIDSFWQCLGDISLWFSFEINGTRDSTANFEYRVIQGHCKEINQGNYIWEFEELKRKLEEMGLDLSNNYNDFKERLDILLEMFKTMNTYSKEEIDRMLVKLIAGEKISATFTMDYKGKVAGSLVENSNIAKWVHNSELLEPNATSYNEFNQSYYNLLTNGVFANNAPTTGARAISIFNFNFYEDFKRKVPSLFPSNNNVQSNVESFKKIFKTAKWGVYCKGSSSAGNKATMRIWNQSSWVVPRENNTDKLAKLQDNTVNPIYINEKGILSLIVYAEPNDGKTVSVLQVNNPSADYTVELSLRDIFTTKEELEAVKVALEATKNELKKDIADLKTYVNGELNKKEDQLIDSGWVKATLSAGAIQDVNNPLKYRKRDKLVIVKGYVTLPNNVGAIIWTPPTGFAPSSQEIIRVTLEDTNADRKAFVRFSGGRLMVAYNNWSSSAYYLEAIYYVD
ncbi:BppU family phage baseplate upper protein [Carnobacterium divergens]|uniref:BppU family phage baseplate upper protein n=1 Tax=Carnobacterium divergens TaxID=2748 RepID=UPI0039BDE196